MDKGRLKFLLVEAGFWFYSVFALAVMFVMLIPALFPPEKPPYPIEESPVYGGTLRIDVGAPLGDLNPYGGGHHGATYAMQAMYNFLCAKAGEGKLSPDLADSWTSDETSRIWRFHLRQGVSFHNGRKVTAADVKYSIQEAFRQWFPSMKESVHGIEILNEAHVGIRLSVSFPDFLEYVSQIPIIPKDSLQNGTDWYESPVGTGPFRFGSRDGDRSIVLDAFPGYYEGRPRLDHLEFTFPDPEESVLWRFLKERSDAVLEAEPRYLLFLNGVPYFQRAYLTTIPYYYVIMINHRRPPFDDSRARAAVAYAIDASRLSENFVGGGEAPVHAGQPWEEAAPFAKPLPFDFRKAEDLLASAGWKLGDDGLYVNKDSEPFEVNLLVPAEFTWEIDAAERLQGQLLRFGIDLHVEIMEYRAMEEGRLKPGRFDAALNIVRLHIDQPEHMHNLFHSTGGWNFGGYGNPDADALLAGVLHEPDRDRRMELYRELGRRFSDDLPVIFLAQKRIVSTMSDYFGGLESVTVRPSARKEYQLVYLKQGAEPGGFQLLNHQRAPELGLFWGKPTFLEAVDAYRKDSQ
ncbi:MAG: ABC transporter substrate-binding protein [Deltaproteobacteria bacterium]|nr:ABC transporter substrate-binding protein [Deltaproteobacteria bacterium]